jgi:hypothetical protein
MHFITAANLKWQPHTSDVFTEGALTLCYDVDLARDEAWRPALCISPSVANMPQLCTTLC